MAAHSQGEGGGRGDTQSLCAAGLHLFIEHLGEWVEEGVGG